MVDYRAMRLAELRRDITAMMDASREPDELHHRLAIYAAAKGVHLGHVHDIKQVIAFEKRTGKTRGMRHG